MSRGSTAVFAFPSFLLLSVALAALFLSLSSCAPPLALALADMESDMALGDYAGAAAQMNRLLRHSWPEAATLSILKRGRALSRASGWSAPHAQACLQASRRYPASGGAAFLAAEALLEADRASDALPATRYLAARDVSPSLCSAVFLAAFSSGYALAPEDWAFLAASEKNPSYLERAALAELSAGRAARAAVYLAEALSKGHRASPELLYACGMYEACLSLLPPGGTPGSELELLRADVLWRLGREKEARRIWRDAAALPGMPLAVHLNAAASLGRLEDKLAILERAQAEAEASDRPHIDLARAAAYLEAGKPLEAKLLVWSLGGWNGDASSRAALALAIEAEGRDDVRVEALCLSACETSPGDARLRRWAVWRLMALGRMEAAVKLLAMPGLESDPWIAFGRAALAAARDGQRAPMEALASSSDTRFAASARGNLLIMDGWKTAVEGSE